MKFALSCLMMLSIRCGRGGVTCLEVLPEVLAIEALGHRCYKRGREVQRMLNLPSRWEVNRFLKNTQAYRLYRCRSRSGHGRHPQTAITMRIVYCCDSQAGNSRLVGNTTTLPAGF